eukprot:COSAG02_NODE_51098_length_316_cov_0.894009_2_plen_35_part_01
MLTGVHLVKIRVSLLPACLIGNVCWDSGGFTTAWA